MMARLAKGAETTTSMAFLVMCADKIPRLLRLFFVTILFWSNAGHGRVSLWMALMEIFGLESAELLLGG